MQRKNNIVLRLHRQRKPEQVLLPLVREDNGEALRVILEKQDNVTFCRNSIVTELLGRECLTGIRLQNGRELEISGLFVCIGRTPVSALGGEQLRRTPDGYYCADETTRTGLPGVFAAGDVREKQLRQIVTAVSDGAAAAQQAEHYLGKTSRRAEI